ncbi:MAG: TatD family hydrolase [Pseudomonadota bacterium]
MLVDSHCHLDFPDFAEDLPDVVARAEAAGVRRMVTICTRPRQIDGVRAIAERFESVYFAAGLHPLNAHEEPHPDLDTLLGWAAHPKMVGIGEAGLDYHYQRETEAAQKASFEPQIEAARRTGLPLIIHSRDADEDMAAILRREHAAGPFPCVMHCFSSGPALAETALELGFYLSMSGVATFKKAEALREIFKAAPLERILVETDAPYLAPPPHRGKRNEPAYVARTAAVGAELFEMSDEAFANQTTENFHRLFAKVPRAQTTTSDGEAAA